SSVRMMWAVAVESMVSTFPGYDDSKISIRLELALMWLPPMASVRSAGVKVLDAWIVPGRSLIVAVSELMSNPMLLPVSAMSNCRRALKGLQRRVNVGVMVTVALNVTIADSDPCAP